MKCTRCSAEIPAQSQFCLRCGTPIHTGAVHPTGVLPAGANPRPSLNRPLMASLIALALAVIGLGALVLHLTSKPAMPTPNPLVQAPPPLSVPSNIVQAPDNTPPPPPVQQPTIVPADTPPPQDVIDYLKFLKRIEATKKQLIHAQSADLSVAQTMLPVDQIKSYLNFDQDPGQGGSGQDDAKKRLEDLSKRTNEIGNQWNLLAAEFNQVSPPESCRDLRNKYLDQLGKIQAEIIQVYAILGKVQADPASALHDAEAMKGSGADVDTAMRLADDELGNVCHKFKLTKDFDISEGSSASLIK